MSANIFSLKKLAGFTNRVPNDVSVQMLVVDYEKCKLLIRKVLIVNQGMCYLFIRKNDNCSLGQVSVVHQESVNCSLGKVSTVHQDKCQCHQVQVIISVPNILRCLFQLQCFWCLQQSLHRLPHDESYWPVWYEVCFMRRPSWMKWQDSQNYHLIASYV